MHTILDNLTVELGKELILRDINCGFAPRQLSAVVGANGTGKTTLLRTVAGIYQGVTGTVAVDGELLDFTNLMQRRRLHLLEEAPVFVGDTPLEHICMAARYYDGDPQMLKPLILNWLHTFHLTKVALRPMSILSRGERYKAGFVGLLATQTELWLLDEPFASGVDPAGMAAMRREINKFLGQGGTVVYTTQIVEIAEQFSDRVLVLDDRQVKWDIPTPELRQATHDRALERILVELQVKP